MKVYEVITDRASEFYGINQGVDLHRGIDGSSDELSVVLANESLIELHRTAPHVDRLTNHEGRRLYSAHPVLRVDSGKLELASDILRDDTYRVMVVIRSSNPEPWTFADVVGEDGKGIHSSKYAKDVIGKPVLLAESTPKQIDDTLKDTVWLMSVGCGIKLNDTFTLSFSANELLIQRSIDWISKAQTDAYHTDEIWI